MAGMIFNVPALRQFIKTKNTVVTIKPASSLQTNGIYSVCRNPMYTGLLLHIPGPGLDFWKLVDSYPDSRI